MSDIQTHLSRRERQIMDLLFELGQASVNDIRQRLPDPPTQTAIRTLLSILETKGHVQRQKRGRENVYTARIAKSRAGYSALRKVIQTFFDGSLDRALSAYLGGKAGKVSDEELQQAAELIQNARRKN